MNPENALSELRFKRVIIQPECHLKLAYSAGTKHPHIATTVSKPICRKYVLFPARKTLDLHSVYYPEPDVLQTRHALANNIK